MMSGLHWSPLRAIRSPAPALAAALTVLWAVAGIVPEARDQTGDPVARHQTDVSLPADTLSHRAPDLQSTDRDRDRHQGPGRASARRGDELHADITGTARAVPASAPENAALLALSRAGRNSDPATAPPQLS